MTLNEPDTLIVRLECPVCETPLGQIARTAPYGGAFIITCPECDSEVWFGIGPEGIFRRRYPAERGGKMT